jgi:mannose-1-phosphate guanylyltransferase
VLTDLDLAAIFREHREGRLATLVLHDCPPHNHVWVGRGEMVRGIGSIPAAEGLPLAYTGIQVTGPEMLDRLPTGNYDLVKAWQEAIAQGGRLIGKVFSEHFWQDLGTPEDYLTAHRRLLKGDAPGLAPFLPEPTDPLLGPGVKIGPGVEFLGGVCLGAEVEVGEGASLKNTVVWDRARIAPGVRLESCIVAAGVQIADSAQGVVLG